jgi:hypothetical protein
MTILPIRAAHASRRGNTTDTCDLSNAVVGVLGHEIAADIRQAATLAADELLGGAFDEHALIRIATDLSELQLAYSTHDLAASVALTALKSVSPPNRKDELVRMTLLEWYREGKLQRTSAQAFDTTYRFASGAPP